MTTTKSTAASPSSSDSYLKTPAACEYLNISTATIRRWVKDNRLRARRTPTGEYRFKKADLDAVLA
jgi:excisionase family DNA binding protein